MRAAQAHQRLAGHDAAGMAVDHGLIVQLQGALGDGFAQGLAHIALAAQGLVHGGVEHAVDAAAIGLGAVQGHVG